MLRRQMRYVFCYSWPKTLQRSEDGLPSTFRARAPAGISSRSRRSTGLAQVSIGRSVTLTWAGSSVRVGGEALHPGNPAGHARLAGRWLPNYRP